MVYYLSLELYNTTNDFSSIIQMAVNKVNSAHLIDFLPTTSNHSTCTNYIIHDPQTVYNWFCQYRDNSNCFLNPNQDAINEKLPPVLNASPDLVKNILSFCQNNIETLTS